MEYFFKVIDKIRISIAYGNKYLRIFIRFFFQIGVAGNMMNVGGRANKRDRWGER